MINGAIKVTKTKDDILLPEFRDHFMNLSWSDDAEKTNTAAFDPRSISHSLNEEINKVFSVVEVNNVIKKLKNSKACGIDSVINEFLKNSPQEMLQVLVKFFNIVLDSGIVPTDWCIGLIQPLYKNKGSAKNPDNYRGITLLSCIGKLFTAVLNARLTTYIEGMGIMGGEQAGFREGYSTTDQIFVLHSLIDFYLFGAQRLYCAFIDYKKAFDLVNRTHLWGKLIACGINGKVITVIYNMYLNAKSCVKKGAVLSEFFACNIGVRQGENLSPLLFAIYLNDFEQYLSHHYDGLASFSRAVKQCLSNEDIEVFLKLFVLLYADDTVVMAETAEQLNIALTAVYNYCKLWDLTVNTSKTKVVILSRGKVQQYPDFKFGDSVLEVVSDYLDLGTIFNYNNRFPKAIQRQVTQAKKAMFALVTKTRRLCLPVDITCDLFDKTILPILLYGCEIWGFSNVKDIEIFYRKFLKNILKLSSSTPNCMVYGEVGRVPLQNIIDKRMLNFWHRTVYSKESKLSNTVYRVLLKLHFDDIYHSGWLLKIKSILDNTGFSYVWQSQSVIFDGVNVKIKIEKRIDDIAYQNWFRAVSNLKQCSCYKNFKKTLEMERYLINLDFYNRIRFCKFGCGNHKMPVSDNRYDVTKESLQCHLCDTASIGDEFHYLLVCQAFAPERKSYIKKY